MAAMRLAFVAGVVLVLGGDVAAAELKGQSPRLVVQTGHSGTIQAAAFSSDGKLLLTAGLDRTAILWDTATGKKLNQFQGHAGYVTAVAISTTGTHVATIADDGTARMWDTATGRVLHSMKPKSSPRAVVFAADNTKAFLLNSSQVVEWSVATGETSAAFDIKPSFTTPRATAGDIGWYMGFGEKPTITGWSLTNGKAQLTLPAFTDRIDTASASHDHKRLLLLTGLPMPGNKAKLLSVPDGKELHTFDSDGAQVLSVALSADGKRAAIGTARKGVLVYDTETGKKLGGYTPYGNNCWGVLCTPDAKRVLVWTESVANLFDAETGKFVRGFSGSAVKVTAIHPPTRGDQIIARYGWIERIAWDLHASRPTRAKLPRGGDIPFAYDPWGDRVVAPATRPNEAILLDVRTGKELGVYKPHGTRATDAEFIAEGKRVLTADGKAVRVWDTTTQKLMAEKPHTVPADVNAFSPKPQAIASRSGKQFVLHAKDAAAIWTTDPLAEVCRLDGFKGYLYAADFIDNGGTVVTLALGGGDLDFRKVRLWDANTGKHKRDITVTNNMVGTFAFSPDGKLLATGDQSGALVLWDAVEGTRLRAGVGHWGSVNDLAFSPDGKWLYSAGDDGTLRLWDPLTGEWRLALTHFANGSWAVFDREGRFDTNDLDAISGLHWVMPDEPFRALSPEIFMRDYYEPKLLARVLAGEKLRPLRSVAELNRVQPTVKVSKVTPNQNDEVRVTVEVANQSRSFTRANSPVTLESGAYDLHLFRDGQLVSLRAGKIELDANGRAAITFDRIRLPHNGAKQVEFSAYAFNSDRVKSDTARLTHTLPNLAARKGTAFVVCMGVNGFDEPKWNLRFAVPDAKVMAATLEDTLKRSGHFEKVVVVPLLSEPRFNKDGQRTGNATTATKENLRAVLAILAGGKPDADLLKGVSAATGLREACPEDTVILTFSTHGYNGSDGRFYLFPSDIGTGHGKNVTDALLKRAISSDELTDWLRGVDAGEMVAVVDACHSAGSVEQEGFKPGPMGSRGLGQLAYNKRMRILAASQADDVAFEDDRIGHGLLTYALCKDGLKAARADFEPADGTIRLGEWLRYGVRRVPEVADEIATGKTRAVSVTGRALVPIDGQQKVAQQPSLFDFTKGTADFPLATVPKK